MNPALKNTLAVLLGLVLGGCINMGIIILGPMIIAPPTGVNPGDMESISSNIHLFEAKHFVTPFLAHALGTLLGGVIAYLFAASYKSRMTYVVGFIFLLGGIMAARQLPAPLWFEVSDLVLAYLPMAWLATKLAPKLVKN